MPGNQHTGVRDLARAVSAIGPNDDFVIAAVPGARMAAVANQYRDSTQEAGAAEFKVLIMDGGTFDLYLSPNTDATIENVVSTFEQFLATIADEGFVEHVIYFYCPEHRMLPGVATLRPLMQQTCEGSPVDCYFLDLQPLWDGHPEYSNGIQSSVAGAQVIADQIWGIMQENCIAQRRLCNRIGSWLSDLSPSEPIELLLLLLSVSERSHPLRIHIPRKPSHRKRTKRL